MALPREPRGKIRTLERRLGFYTERGLQRTREADLSADVKSMLDRIDEIKRDHLHVPLHELPTSESLQNASNDLFWDIGPRLWPEDGGKAWICVDPEFYERPLAFLEDEHRSILRQYFFDLVVEKTATYQRNQAAMRERNAAKASLMKLETEHPTGEPFGSATKEFQPFEGSSSPPPLGQRTHVDKLGRDFDDTPDVPGGSNGDKIYGAGEGRQRKRERSEQEMDVVARKRFRSDDGFPGAALDERYGISKVHYIHSDGEVTTTANAHPANGVRSLLVRLPLSAIDNLKRQQSGVTDLERSSGKDPNPPSEQTHRRTESHTPAVVSPTPVRQDNVLGETAPGCSEGRTSTTDAGKNGTSRQDFHIRDIYMKEGGAQSICTPPARPHRHAGEDKIDEQRGRHRQPKELRACDRCRKHKLRCEGAFSEGSDGAWSCGRCFRQGHRCVLPNSNLATTESTKATERRSLPDVTTDEATVHVPQSARHSRPPGPMPSFDRRSKQHDSPMDGHRDTVQQSTLENGRASYRVQSPDIGADVESQPDTGFTAWRNADTAISEETLRAPRQGVQDFRRAEEGSIMLRRLSDVRSDAQHEPGLAVSPHTAHHPIDGGLDRRWSNAADIDSRFEVSDGVPLSAQGLASVPTEQPETVGVHGQESSGRTASRMFTSAVGPTAPFRDFETASATLASSSQADTAMTIVPAGVAASRDAKPSHEPATAPQRDPELKPGIDTTANRSCSASETPKLLAFDTGKLIIVEWKHKDDTVASVSRLTRWSSKLLAAVRNDAPASFENKRLVTVRRGTVSMSAASVLEQYGESIASEALEDCMQFLVDEAFGEDADVERTWQKATVVMRD